MVAEAAWLSALFQQVLTHLVSGLATRIARISKEAGGMVGSVDSFLAPRVKLSHFLYEVAYPFFNDVGKNQSLQRIGPF
jgi:hypothetical protein